MKYWIFALLGSVMVSGLSGCGEDRGALAHTTVQSYWDNIAHAHLSTAYAMLTDGEQKNTKRKDYTLGLIDFLRQTAGIRAIVGKPRVQGDQAVVPVTLKASRAPNPRDDEHAFQHLYWQDGKWRIADANGGLSKNRNV